MFTRRKITICREGWYYLVVLWFIIGGAMMRDINLLLVLAGMMLGPLLISWWLVVVTLRRLKVERKLPDAVSAGDLLVVEITGTNRRRRLDSWAVVVEDRILSEGQAAQGGEAARAKVMLPRIVPGQTVTAAYRGRLHRRGQYQFGPLRVSTRVPLGLLRATLSVAETAPLLVCPRLGRLSPRWAAVVQPDRIGSQRSKHRQGLLEGDYYGLRDWRSGDSRRWIHWRTSARRNQLSVRQFEQQRNQDMVLLLDAHHPDAGADGPLDDIEVAISFVATVIADQCRRGSSELLVGVAGQTIEIARGVSSMVMLQEVMQHLAAAEPSPQDRLPELLDRTLAQVKPGTRIVVISTRQTDLSDTERFSAVWDDPRKRATLGRIVCVNVNSTEFERYFQVESA